MRAIGIYVVIIAIIFVLRIHGTIDVNLSELEYLAARLSPVECRRLIAALHYTSYDLPSSLAEAERKVDEEIPCLRLLLHWNNSPDEGRGKTHAAIVHRLRQLNRNDLADWLGKTTFKQLGKDLDNAITLSFDELAEEEMETSTLITTTSVMWIQEENPWLTIDTILMAVLLGLLGTLFVLIVAIIIHTVKSNKN
ncbi:PREDICTED: uncharacterized protein LOC108751301 isoform X1 [Trachymyrmex septentrionalis]|uniref:uncharacterized protein LOC108751301 isoform X1 n=1 Tax=Trachymyrmex septentrionalis TaxID=34720 RepID=UPI00084F4A95|nr:PREDICTED: uncharacterized protein LOC108751301 isoform X1 [Trachymyrmex septentrionalis]XP_018346906.1 PREDICTED: uncharacterized protein LOC108751301 isoform X1 [Trachymyrmex septentrionalis]